MVTQANHEVSPTEAKPHKNMESQVSLSSLLKHGVVEIAGEPGARLDDVIVQFIRNDYAPITGLVIKAGERSKFIPADNILDIRPDVIEVRPGGWEIKSLTLENDEISLRSGILCQRVVDVARSTLVKVYDARLAQGTKGWTVVALDVHRGRWFAFGSHAAHPARDWRNFLPLPSLDGSPIARSSPSWIGRLRPAQIADLIEAANADEQDRLLEQVHSDPELEADVFEELEDDRQALVFKSRTDADVAKVLTRMRADDAADAVMELAQERRQAVLGLLPEAERTKIMTLLGYNEATAGGLMGTEFIAVSEDTTVRSALQRIRDSAGHQPEALVTIHALSSDGKLVGTLGLVRAVQANPANTLRDVVDRDLVTASPKDDLSTVITRMADFNLLSMPVVDEAGFLLGIVTVDDALEAALPAHWTSR